MGITDIKPVDLINVDMEDHGWRYDRLRTLDEGYTEFFYRGPDTLTMGWAWSPDPADRALHLLSPIYINDTAWPVSSPTDLARALDEDRRLAQPLPAIYDTRPRRHTALELYHLRDEITEQLAEFRPELPEPESHEPTPGSDVEDASRQRTLNLDPALPPWEADHDGVVFDRSSPPQAIEPGDPEWPPWLSTSPLWDSPSPEASLSSNATAVDRGDEVGASQHFAALSPAQVEAARGLLRDYPDGVPSDEVNRRGLTLDDVSAVYLADTGELSEVDRADATMTDPWRPPAADPWRPATTPSVTEHVDAQRDRQRASDAVPERGGETSPQPRDLGADGVGGAPDDTGIGTAVNRLVDREPVGDEPHGPRGYTLDALRAVLRDEPWSWGDPESRARHARVGPEPDLPPWDVSDERVSPGGTPEPRVMRVILPDGRTAYMDAPPPAGPEELVSRDAMVVDRGDEVPASQRFAAMEPEQVQAARALLRDHPDTVPWNEVGRRGLTLDDVSLVYRADIGDLPDVTTTDPSQPPSAAPWQPTTAPPATELEDAQHDRQPVAGMADAVPEHGGQSTPERSGPATEVAADHPEFTPVRTALDRLVEGQITNEDLDRLGITPEQYAQLVGSDRNLDRAGDHDRAEVAADVDGATAQSLPEREYAGTSSASGTPVDHQAQQRATYEAWSTTVRRDLAGASSFWRDVIGDDIVVGGVVYSADVYTADGEGGVRRLTATERAVREASFDHEAADRVDRLQERLGDIRETLRTSVRERAPTGDAAPTGAALPGRQANPDIGDSASLPYENPAGTEPTALADPQYQESEFTPGPTIEI